MQGWVKLHRKILHSEIFENEKMLKVFIYCIAKSSHKVTESRVGRQKVELEPGQFIFGRKKAASELNMSASTVRDYIKTLQEDGVITVKSTNKYSVVTVENWALYQSNGEEHDNKTTADKHQKDSSPTLEGQQKDTYKNEQELKEVKNVKEFITTTTSEQNSEAVQFYQNNFGVLRPHISGEIAGWIAEIGDELTIEAMKRSLDRNKVTWGYVKSILQSWLNKGIKTIEQAEAEEFEHRDRIHRKREFSSKEPSSQEVIPEWFKSRNEQKQQENKKPTIDDTARTIELGIMLKRSRESILESIHNRYDLSEEDLDAIREGEGTAKEILLSKTNLKVVGDP